MKVRRIACGAVSYRASRPRRISASIVASKRVANLDHRIVSDDSVGGRIRTARLSLTGRNLLRFTGYRGLDPEVSNFGNQAIVRNIDVAPVPPSRSFFFSIDLGL